MFAALPVEDACHSCLGQATEEKVGNGYSPVARVRQTTLSAGVHDHCEEPEHPGKQNLPVKRHRLSPQKHEPEDKPESACRNQIRHHFAAGRLRPCVAKGALPSMLICSLSLLLSAPPSLSDAASSGCDWTLVSSASLSTPASFRMS